MYKAVFSDFDGTLLTSDHRISPKTLDAIQRITENTKPSPDPALLPGSDADSVMSYGFVP